MLKKLAVLVLSTLYLVFGAGAVLAQNEFIVDSNVTYEVSETGTTLVTHEIFLENAFSTLYATSYSLNLENIEANNVQARSATGQQLSVNTAKDGDRTNIKIEFTDAVVGRGKSRHFFVTYENTSFASKTGEVWEISIPKLSSDSSFRSYQATLKVPLKFGLEAYISPKPDSSEEQANTRVYTFSKNDLVKTGVTAGFGEFQVFTYTLNYHLENPLARSAETEIALPPDTAFQKVYLRSINPEPLTIRIDEDGNWLASYKLTSRQRLDVVVTGEVQIFASERKFPKPTDEVLASNLQTSNYWETNDLQIKALAQELKTPRAIYDYVWQNLKYDYDRVRPNVERLGAKGALLTPTNSICMEFTDLFIALSRAAGIPAREINGYAYTENPEIQPLSLVADVLHSWPEYWDDTRGAWIPVDPTWASTTGGVNFFDKLDLRHFTFVIHGEDALKPYAPGSYKLGANPQKDVFVFFGKLSTDQTSYPQIKATFKPGVLFFNSSINISIRNPGPSAYYSFYPEIYFDSKLHSRDYIEVLPPFSSYEMDVKVPYSFFGKDTPNVVKIVVDGSDLSLSTNKNRVIITSLTITFIIITIFIIVILIRLKWKNKLQAAFRKARESIYSKREMGRSTSERP